MRLIDADALTANISSMRVYVGGKDITDPEYRKSVLTAIAEAPTVDAIVPQWIPVTPETMPESGVAVLLCCERRYHDGRIYRYICDGEYIAKHTETASGIDDDLSVEYDEETDEYYLAEGFYERINNWDEYSSVVISDFVTHWMTMPQPPEVKLCEND